MNKLLNKLKLVLIVLRDLIPSPLPQGMTEFDNWAKSIIKDYGFPDNESVNSALAAMIMHTGPLAAYKPRMYFILCLKAGAAKQIAGAVFYDINQRNKAKQAAEALAQQQVAQSEPKQ